MSQAQEPQSFRQLLGVQPSKATAKDSTLVIIDAQNELSSPTALSKGSNGKSIRYTNCRIQSDMPTGT